MAHDDPITSGRSLNDLLKAKSRSRRAAIGRTAACAIAPQPGRNDLVPRLELVFRDPRDLTIPERNVRTIDTAHVREVANSIAAFGFSDPVLIDETGRVRDGVVRVEAAKHHGLRSIPCIIASHLTASQWRQLRLTINRLQEKGAWNLDELRFEMQELIVEDVSLEFTGFTESEIDQIVLEEEPALTEEGPLEPDLGAPPVAKLGDIYALGLHKVICGDARDPTVLPAVMGQDQAQLILTDEPYNVRIKDNVTGGAHREFAMASGEMSDAAFATFNTDWMRAGLGFLVDGGLFGTFIDWRGYPIVHAAAVPSRRGV